MPVIWDKHTHTIVSNESPEIIRMFNSALDGVGAIPRDFFPPQLLTEIDELNDFIYPNINNGVYCAGFATWHRDMALLSGINYSGIMPPST